MRPTLEAETRRPATPSSLQEKRWTRGPTLKMLPDPSSVESRTASRPSSRPVPTLASRRSTVGDLSAAQVNLAAGFEL
jgi:hypothetical protein